ncbi:ZIP family zinc transporter [Natronocella acetinitrilica]|uniref:ZIP family zinc transporter n=1 Tax=Natronocella acetinitrilica TaxID=414046 RepID=A0AAE3G6P1_9GAMM|nr:ZIP family metal transporter [Natronocella acetinitrilica]MCP1676034.1 ZIP family zinc transporter [Natronocella acetinitrilica]
MIDTLTALTDGIPLFYIAAGAALIAGLATCLGAIPVFFLRQLSPRLETAMMSFGAGVMLAATFFSLIDPGLRIAGDLTETLVAPPLWIGLAMLLGAGLFLAADRYLPHEHFISGPDGVTVDHSRLRKVWLFVIAIAIHNFPEGLSVGIGFAGDDFGNGIAITTGISLQNLPEGLVVAVALLSVGYSRLQAFSAAALTGLVMSLGGIVGAAFIGLAGSALMPWALGFAAGAMLFVIIDEIIPETHRRGFEREANLGFMVGFILMMFLDLTLD